MGETELKRALQCEGEKRIRGLWQDAEERVTRRRQEIVDRQAGLRAATDRQLQGEIEQLRGNLLQAARAHAREGQLHAETALAERLLQLARRLLPELPGDREQLWNALCAELPDVKWATVRVVPEDRERARRTFPAAEVETDEALAGGLVATDGEAVLRVDNSLASRLERAWPDLLPQLMAELRSLVDDNETADDDSGL